MNAMSGAILEIDEELPGAEPLAPVAARAAARPER